MARKIIKFRMETFAKYEFSGRQCTWIHEPIIVEVAFNTNTNKMYNAAHNKIAKYIVAHKPFYSKNEYKYFNKIDFHIVEDKPIEKIMKSKPLPKLEYIDLFGQTQQILSNGKVRLKPIPKGQNN